MENQENVLMTAEEKAEFEAFRAAKAEAAAKERAKKMREDYNRLVDEEVDATIPELVKLSEGIRSAKGKVIDNFKAIIAMKGEIFGSKVDTLKSHTFTNSEGNKRITLGVYQTDGYRDTVEDGIEMVKGYIAGLAKDDKTQALVKMVFQLLSRDSKGTLKASRIVQLRKIANETGAPEFMEGVRIIEDSYQPEVSKIFIRAEVKGENNEWRNVPLGMTESQA